MEYRGFEPIQLVAKPHRKGVLHVVLLGVLKIVLKLLKPRKEIDMNFTFIITKNNKPVAGFTTYIDACTYKDILININRTAGYKDKFKIIDTRTTNIKSA